MGLKNVQGLVAFPLLPHHFVPKDSTLERPEGGWGGVVVGWIPNFQSRRILKGKLDTLLGYVGRSETHSTSRTSSYPLEIVNPAPSGTPRSAGAITGHVSTKV